MSVLLTIGTVFFEMTLTVLSVTAFAILIREYAARRYGSLLFYSLAFLAQAFVWATTFAGHVLSANGSLQTSIDSLRMSSAFVAVSGFLLMPAFFHRAKREIRWFLTICAGALAAYAISMLAMLQPIVTQVNGVTFIAYSTWQLIVIYSSLLIAVFSMTLCRLFSALRIRCGGEQLPAASGQQMAVGFFGLLLCTCIVLGAWLETAVLVLPTLAVYLAFLSLAFITAYVEEHPDKAARQKPQLLVRRSLVLKAVAINAVAIWLLSMGMLTAIASLFVENSVNARHVAMQRDLRYFVQVVRTKELDQMDAADRFAEMPEAAALLAGAQDAEPALMSQLGPAAAQVHGTRVFELVDAQGVVRFSTRTDSVTGEPLLDSGPVSSALAEKKRVAIEKDDAFNLWVLRAAVPVYARGGALLGATVVTDIDSAFNFSEYTSIAPISSSGFGFVSESDETVYSSGVSPDQGVRAELRRHVLPFGISFVGDGDSIYFVERTLDSAGASQGYFYVAVTNSALDAEAFRIISLVAVLALFAVILMTALLLFSMTVVLKPIRELRAAAIRVERDEYDHRVKYGSPDELGQLASAFNRMLETIGVRTAALKAAVRERHDFLEHAAKELRTPLNVFRWTLDAMRFGDTGSLNKEQMELVERLHQTSERLSKMVRSLQDVTLIDQGKVTLHKSPIAIEDVVDTVAGQVAVEARKKGVELRWSRPPDGLPKVPADAAYIEKVLMNLVVNAVKYTEQKGYAEIRVSAEDGVRQDGKKGRFVKVTVQDNGIGIPSDDAGRIFSRFFRGANITGFEVEGTGLGLYMAKRLVELHGGRITLESREGVGTTVAFTLPTEPDGTSENGTAIVNA